MAEAHPVKHIILDTNFLLIPAEFKVDIFSEIRRIADFEYRLCIVDKTLEELKNIAEKQRLASKRAVKLTLSLLKTKDLKIIPVQQENSADDSIVSLVSEEPGKYIVATQDKELKQRLKKRNIRLILLKQRKYLVFG